MIINKLIPVTGYKNLLAYKKGFELAMEIFRLSAKFPIEEKYSLIDQVRRSSRSVCTNCAEAFARRRYKDYLLSKLNDCQAENSETQVWLDFALECQYLPIETHIRLSILNSEVGKLLSYMLANPQKFF